MTIRSFILFTSLCLTQTAFADEMISTVTTTGKDPQTLGQVRFVDSPYGLLIIPDLHHLPPGLHGFHLHQHPDCGDHGMHAGSHFDPAGTNSHQGPYGEGHLGDLPVLYANADGIAQVTTLAPRLKVKDLKGLSLMIHEGGDNYSDNPPLGGGGARIGCGLLPQH